MRSADLSLRRLNTLARLLFEHLLLNLGVYNIRPAPGGESSENLDFFARTGARMLPLCAILPHCYDLAFILPVK